jgi:uncharacterized protein
MKLRAFLLVLTALFFISSLVFYLTKHKVFSLQDTTQTLSQRIPAVASIIPTPTPFPFAELTIPYLRNRTYTSSLSELKQYADNSTYTSYLTSYVSDGLNINALLTRPKSNNTQKHPAVIFIHGYIPPTQYKTTDNYSAYVDYLAKNGFVVLKVDLRGHGTSEGEASGAYYSSDYISDVLHAYNALEQTEFVNPNAIGLWGHSMAGNVVMRTLAAKPTIPAAVIWAGAVYTYTDMTEYGIDDNSYRPPPNSTQRQQKRQEMNAMYGPPTNESPFWKQVAPTNFLTDIKGAIQIHHAIDDAVVGIEYSRNVKKFFENANVNHEIIEYPTGGHNIQGNSFNSAMRSTVSFYKTHLK